MDISYAGGASFVIKGERTVVINPTGAAAKAHVVLHSERQRARKLIVNGPGEYEIGGVLIASVRSGRSLAHAVEVNGINVVCLTGRCKDMDPSEMAALGRVDVLLVGADDLQAAREAVAALTPRVVIPFGTQAAEVCAAAGVKAVTPQPRFSWNGTGTPPKAVLLKAPGTRKRAA